MAGTILTLTPNPSLDLLFEAEQLVRDDANRVAAPRRRAGGQGVNLTRAARVLGGDSIAIAVLGGSTGGELAALLEAEGAPLHAARRRPSRQRPARFRPGRFAGCRAL